jgi:protein-L-isoaspartate(D-aspartate) O-methyltransferase
MTAAASTLALNLARKLFETGIRSQSVLSAVANTPRELFLDNALAHKAKDRLSLNPILWRV